MRIRKASAEEMLTLWGEDVENMPPTTAFFYQNITSGNVDFWCWDDEKKIVGELYVFKELKDKDYANGLNRRYLCAFRIKKELRGKGYGTKLMTHVINELTNEGIQCVTIGVDETEKDNIRLYQRIGFLEKIKDCTVDPCNVDENMIPKSCSTYWLLKKDLDNN